MKVLRLVTFAALVLAIVLAAVTLIGWYLTDPGFEPVYVGISAVVSGLVALIGWLRGRAAGEQHQTPGDSQPKIAINVTATDTQIGAVGQVVKVKGGIHFYSLAQGQRPGNPLQRPPRAKHFTGRAAELARLLEALRPGEVVTLCGPGGIGKTALAA